MDKLTLARLPDKFTSNQLTGNIYDNCTKVATFLGQLYKLDDATFFEGTPTLKTFESDNDSKLNRNSYLWLNKCIMELQTMINELISRFNEHGTVDMMTGDSTPNISLWFPHQLGFDDDYKNSINQNWQSIEDKLNGLLSYYTDMFGKEGAS